MKLWWIAFGIYLVPVLLASLVACQIPFAFVDDYAIAPWGEIWSSPASLLRALNEIIWPTDPLRYRWTYVIFDQGLIWAAFGDFPAGQHLWKLLLRVLAGFLAMRIVVQISGKTDYGALIPLTFGLLNPIVPEARLGPQEPLLSVLLLGLITLFLQVEKKGPVSVSAQCLLAILFTLLAGSKETALLVLWGILAAFLYWQWCQKKWYRLLTGWLAAVVALTTWHVLQVSRKSSYIQMLQSDSLVKDSTSKIGQFLLGLEVQRPWVPILLISGLILVLETLWRSRRMRRPIVFPVLILGTLLAYLAPHFKLYVAPRYLMPAIWLLSILLGWTASAQQWDTPGKLLRWRRIWLILMLTLLPAGNISSFITQFTIQARVRQNEARVETELARAIEQGIPIYFAGISEPEGGEVQSNELASLLLAALKDYAPRVRGTSPPVWDHVQNLPEKPILALVVSQWDWDEHPETRKRGYKPTSTVLCVPRTDTFPGIIEESIQWGFGLLKLHNRRLDRITDAGAPPLEEPENALFYRWYIHHLD